MFTWGANGIFSPKNLNVASWWNWIVLSCSHLKTAFFECMEDTSTGERFNPKEVDETHSLWNVLVRNSYDSILNSLLKTYKVDCYLGQKSYMARKAGSTPLWCAEKSVPASISISPCEIVAPWLKEHVVKRGGTSDPSSVSLMKDWRSANKLYLLLQKPFSIPRSLYQLSFLSPISFNF